MIPHDNKTYITANEQLIYIVNPKSKEKMFFKLVYY
jgi:hypothetical protein